MEVERPAWIFFWPMDRRGAFFVAPVVLEVLRLDVVVVGVPATAQEFLRR